MEPSPGGDYTLNRGESEDSARSPVRANRMRVEAIAPIYDLADLDRSLYIQSTGQSGDPVSFYRSFAVRWARGEYIRIPTSRRDRCNGRGHLVRLEPALRSRTPCRSSRRARHYVRPDPTR